MKRIGLIGKTLRYRPQRRVQNIECTQNPTKGRANKTIWHDKQG